MKIIKTLGKDSSQEEIIEVCPICGKSMNETYLGRDYCDDCAEILKRANEGNK